MRSKLSKFEHVGGCPCTVRSELNKFQPVELCCTVRPKLNKFQHVELSCTVRTKLNKFQHVEWAVQ